ncbi:hypothetical protein OWV82_012044 [Melia azedarach]|uniref:Uncharacterized protein n=1 Tax=Melia azedarach TaxID=155640 RepID=A0ACC1Y2F3_MELAZ|nr:hypothetical protein OWV82_012044 [Melia azedarach]
MIRDDIVNGIFKVAIVGRAVKREVAVDAIVCKQLLAKLSWLSECESNEHDLIVSVGNWERGERVVHLRRDDWRRG